MGKFIDLTGQKFGLLTVINRADNYEKFSKTHNRVLKYARWDCVCECGNESLAVLATDLKSSSQNSCGCLRAEKARETMTKHGMGGEKEYIAWKGLKSRCINTNDHNYDDYGGRGIKVQESWIEDFSKFYDYIGAAPSPEHSIDRIDSNGNYEEGNVKWSTKPEQAQNTRKPKNGKNKYKWVTFHKRLQKYKAQFMMNNIIYNRGYFETEVEAAKDVYSFYKDLTGDWPKYCDESLIELGLK